jgi:hypothetical protein
MLTNEGNGVTADDLKNPDGKVIRKGSEVEDEIEIPDEELADLSPDAYDQRVRTVLDEWVWDHIEADYEQLKEG